MKNRAYMRRLVFKALSSNNLNLEEAYKLIKKLDKTRNNSKKELCNSSSSKK